MKINSEKSEDHVHSEVIVLGDYTVRLSLVGEDTIRVDACNTANVAFPPEALNNTPFSRRVILKMTHDIAPATSNTPTFRSEISPPKREKGEKRKSKDTLYLSALQKKKRRFAKKTNPPTAISNSEPMHNNQDNITQQPAIPARTAASPFFRRLRRKCSSRVAKDEQQLSTDNQLADDIAPSNLMHLPVEILQYILSFVPAQTAVHLSFVSKQFKEISEDEIFWRYTFKKKFGCARFLEMAWRQRYLFAERKARIIENYAVFGDRMIWATRYGFARYFKDNVAFADPDETLTDNLRVASFEGHTEIVRAILNHFETMTEAGDLDSWQQCLHTASLSGEKNIVSLVLSHGIVDVDIADVATGKTALMLAASAGNLDIVETLLNSGANVNHQDGEAITPLLSAVENDNLKIAESLLNRGADVNLANADGATPLISAAENGHTAMLQLLIDRGAILNARNSRNATALMEAALGNHAEVVDTLLRYGADISAVDMWGQTALELAAEKGYTSIVEMISRVVVVDQYYYVETPEVPGGEAGLIEFEPQQPSLQAALPQPASVRLFEDPLGPGSTEKQRATHSDFSVPPENWYQE